MRELRPPPLSMCSSGERKQMPNDLIAVAKAKATAQVPFIHKSASQVTSRGRPDKVTDVGVVRAVNQHDLDRFHAEYGFKLIPQLDDRRRRRRRGCTGTGNVPLCQLLEYK